jgi:outer membrane protein assembly factor BamA
MRGVSVYPRPPWPCMPLLHCLPLMLLLLCCSVVSAPAQDSLARVPSPDIPDSLWVVDTVRIVGNNHTKSFVILREMTLKPGSPITQRLLEFDKSRIYSLRLFNQVQIHVEPSTGGSAHLVVEVSERWYLFPYPIFGIRDRDWDKVFFGAGVVHTNFRGRNEKLNAAFVLGFDPSAGLSYRNPFLNSEGTEFIEGQIAFSKVRNRSILAQVGPDNFDERHYTLLGRYGRRFGIEHTAWIELKYEIVDIPGYVPVPTIAQDGVDRFPTATIGYSYDSRDFGEYPSSGMYFGATISKFGFPSAALDIVRYAADVRGYEPVAPNTVLTARVFSNLVAAGRTPSYNRVYFGYGERIRGHFKDVREGESIVGASAELHYTLLPPRYFRVSGLPPEFAVWRFGITATGFADAGTVWFRGVPVALNDFARGYGAGIDFLLPYSAVIRTEYALNEVRHGEFIVEVGASF